MRDGKTLGLNSSIATFGIRTSSTGDNNTFEIDVPKIKKSKTYVLLDIDHTLLRDINQLNYDLILSLKSTGISDVYLFTDMIFRIHDINERIDLVQRLESFGLTVHGVLTTPDLFWRTDIAGKKTLGLFRDEFEIKNINLKKRTNLEKLPELYQQYKSIEDLIINGESQCPNIKLGAAFMDAATNIKQKNAQLFMDASIGAKLALDLMSENYKEKPEPKVFLFKHFLNNKPADCDQCIIFEDREEVLIGVQSEARKVRFPLKTIHVKDSDFTKNSDSSHFYIKNIAAFLTNPVSALVSPFTSNDMEVNESSSIKHDSTVEVLLKGLISITDSLNLIYEEIIPKIRQLDSKHIFNTIKNYLQSGNQHNVLSPNLSGLPPVLSFAQQINLNFSPDYILNLPVPHKADIPLEDSEKIPSIYNFLNRTDGQILEDLNAFNLMTDTVKRNRFENTASGILRLVENLPAPIDDKALVDFFCFKFLMKFYVVLVHHLFPNLQIITFYYYLHKKLFDKDSVINDSANLSDSQRRISMLLQNCKIQKRDQKIEIVFESGIFAKDFLTELSQRSSACQTQNIKWVLGKPDLYVIEFTENEWKRLQEKKQFSLPDKNQIDFNNYLSKSPNSNSLWNQFKCNFEELTNKFTTLKCPSSLFKDLFFDELKLGGLSTEVLVKIDEDVQKYFALSHTHIDAMSISAQTILPLFSNDNDWLRLMTLNMELMQKIFKLTIEEQVCLRKDIPTLTNIRQTISSLMKDLQSLESQKPKRKISTSLFTEKNKPGKLLEFHNQFHYVIIQSNNLFNQIYGRFESLLKKLRETKSFTYSTILKNNNVFIQNETGILSDLSIGWDDLEKSGCLVYWSIAMAVFQTLIFLPKSYLNYPLDITT